MEPCFILLTLRPYTLWSSIPRVKTTAQLSDAESFGFDVKQTLTNSYSWYNVEKSFTSRAKMEIFLSFWYQKTYFETCFHRAIRSCGEYSVHIPTDIKPKCHFIPEGWIWLAHTVSCCHSVFVGACVINSCFLNNFQ